MIKKIVIILFMFLLFMGGISVGGNFTKGTSELFEESKEEFENNVTSPNHEDKDYQLVPHENVINKIAHKIDEFINKKISKIFGKSKN